jgi:hypothetical protein
MCAGRWGTHEVWELFPKRDRHPALNGHASPSLRTSLTQRWSQPPPNPTHITTGPAVDSPLPRTPQHRHCRVLLTMKAPALNSQHGAPQALAKVPLHHWARTMKELGLPALQACPNLVFQGGTGGSQSSQTQAEQVSRPLLNRHWSPLALGPRCPPGAPSWQHPGYRSCQSHRRSPTLQEQSRV